MKRAAVFMKKRYAVALLAALVLASLVLRLHNLSDYKFYPDSYQSLVVSRNLRDYGSPVGSLGNDGMLYPDFFGWSRPLYPFLIITASLATGNDVESARIVAVTAGLAALPMAYLLGKRVFGRRLPGLAAAGLLAASFNFTVWGGFIMSETLGVLCLLFLLERIAYIRNKPTASWTAFASAGLAVALCILARYEYAVIVPPAAYLLWTAKPRNVTFMVVSGAAAIVSLSLWFTVFPLPYSPSSLWEQVRILAVLAAAAMAIAVLAGLAVQLALRKLPALRLRIPAVNARQGLLLAGALLAAIWLEPVPLEGLKRFIAYDFLLAGLGGAGAVAMIRRQKYCQLTAGLLAAATLLGIAYYRVNPEMERYLTHLIPFILVPAAFAADRFIYAFLTTPKSTARLRLHKLRMPALLTPALMIILQTLLSYNGLHPRGNGIWFTPGYEEVSAKKAVPFEDPDGLLIASLPEPYFYFSGIPTYSVATIKPYIFIDPRYANKTVTIIDDMAMRQYFPAFSDFLRENLTDRVKTEYFVGTPYRFADTVKAECSPVKIYQVSLSELQDKLKAVQ